MPIGRRYLLIVFLTPFLGIGCASEPACPTAPATDVTPATATQALYVGSGDPYSAGALAVRTIALDRCFEGLERPVEIHAPTAAGRYAVVVFQHGFLLDNSYYDDILNHLAGHGFVVVAPQMYRSGGLPLGQPTTNKETADGLAVVDWLAEHLSAVTGVEADVAWLGLVGHSRGGKVAFKMVRERPEMARAVMGLDPVDGSLDGSEQVTAGAFTATIPKFILGAGIERTEAHPLGGSCSPTGLNYLRFFEVSTSPCWLVIAGDHGHLDMLDEDAFSECGLICDVCTSGHDRDRMRALTGGMMTAFFRASLQGDTDAFQWLTDVAGAPTGIDVQVK